MSAKILTLPLDTTIASANLACGCGECNQLIDITLVHTRANRFVVSVVVTDPDVELESLFMPVILTCADVSMAMQRYNRQLTWHIGQGARILAQMKPVIQ